MDNNQQKHISPGLLGALLGLGLGLSLVIFGLIKTLFLVVMAVVGYYLGTRYLRNHEALRNLLDKLLPPGKFR